MLRFGCELRLPFRNRNTPPSRGPPLGRSVPPIIPDPLRRAPRPSPPTPGGPPHVWDGPPPEYQRPGSQQCSPGPVGQPRRRRRRRRPGQHRLAPPTDPTPPAPRSRPPPSTLQQESGAGPGRRLRRSSPTSRPSPRRWRPPPRPCRRRRPPRPRPRPRLRRRLLRRPRRLPRRRPVAPVATGSGYSDPNNPAAWDRLAQCESGGNWAANTGNGYYGGIQFSLELVAGRRRHRLPAPGQPRDPDRHGPAPLEPGRLVPLARLQQQARLPLSPQRLCGDTSPCDGQSAQP